MQETYNELDAAAELDALEDVDALEDEDTLDAYDTELDVDALEDSAERWDADEGSEDLWEADALGDETTDSAGDFYETIEDAFAESMDADDEDEFMARVRGNLQVKGMLQVEPLPWYPPRPPRPPRRPRPPRPRLAPWRQLALQALPAAERVVQAGSATAGGLLGGALGRQAGGAVGGVFGPVGRVVGGVAGGALGGWGGRALGGWAGRRLTDWASPRIRRWLRDGMDAMDAFADIAVDNLFSEDDFDEFIPVMAGLAGRYVVRAAQPPGLQGRRSAQSRELGRQVMRATRRATQIVVGRHGRQAVRSVPRVVRQALRDTVTRGGTPRSIPGRIVRRAQQLAGRPGAVRRLSRPSPRARRIRAVAGLPAGRRLPARVTPVAYEGTTVALNGPVEIVVER